QHPGATFSNLVPTISDLFGIPRPVLSENEHLWMESVLAILQDMHDESLIHCISIINGQRHIGEEIRWDNRGYIILEPTRRGLMFLQTREVPPSKYGRTRNRVLSKPMT